MIRLLIFVSYVYFFSNTLCQEIITEDSIVCEDNNTCIEDNIFNTTEIVILNDNKTTENRTENTNLYHFNSNIDINECFCNLQRNICDINCCCDNDCSLQQKLIFSKCDKNLEVYNPKFCYTSSNSDGREKESFKIDQYEFFCVISTNLPSYTFEIGQFIHSITEAEKLTSHYYNWPDVISEESKTFDLTNVLRNGDIMWIRKHNNSKIETFCLPKGGISNVCMFDENIRFLQKYASSCSHVINEENNDYLYPITYFDFTVIKFNNSLNFSLINDLQKKCPQHVCLSVNINLCDELLNNCEQVFKNDSRLIYEIDSSIDSLTYQNFVKKVKYDFYHNGTYGITKVDLYLNLINSTIYLTNENESYEQFFEVNFFWDGYEKNYSSLMSGQPGYLNNKPILIANMNYTTLNITENYKRFKFIQNGSNIEDNFMIVPVSVNGFCQLNNNENSVIEFGYNGLKKCNHKHLFKKVLTNATEICLGLQKELFQLWSIKKYKNHTVQYVATFGNSNRYHTNDWIDIKYKFDINEIFRNISGIKHNNKIVCYNIAYMLKINILYANIDFGINKNQKKIVHVNMDLNIVNNFDFYMIDIDTTDDSVDCQVYTMIRHYDVTGTKLEKYLDPPTFQTTTPRDFFYPFMSFSNKLNSNFVLLLISFNLLLVITKH